MLFVSIILIAVGAYLLPLGGLHRRYPFFSQFHKREWEGQQRGSLLHDESSSQREATRFRLGLILIGLGVFMLAVPYLATWIGIGQYLFLGFGLLCLGLFLLPKDIFGSPIRRGRRGEELSDESPEIEGRADWQKVRLVVSLALVGLGILLLLLLGVG